MKKARSSKALIVFGTLLAIGVVTTVVLLCLTKENPNYWDDVLLSFGAVSLIGVCFLMYIKEVVIKEKWSEIPLVGKAIWWLMFVSHSYNFIDQFMTVFIFR
ncbi:hypothetical protein P4679_36010 [Priestia megaterium]|jgi:uncharacterized protein (DUF983 family)|uniref:hypothetical protein n=1 Tax=Priestia megaterium TaxID=1404 RepID=UPI002E1D48B8|nr:hypothetical protein [Priestia megaterium]